MLKKLLFGVTIVVALLTCFVAAILILPLPEMPRVGVTGDILISNVAVLSVETGTVLEYQNVVVRDGVIAAVEGADLASEYETLNVIDGTGKYLMPGLWDMHTHSFKLSSQYLHPLFIANGVTGVRDMSGCMSEPDSFFACIDDRERWNAALRDGTGLSPRYVLQSSFQINGGNEVPDGFPEFFKARNADEATRLVEFYTEAGADFLKPYTELSPVAYRAMADQARKHGLSLAGHRPIRVSLEEALAAGQRSIEHPRLFLFECYAGADDFRSLPDPYVAYDTEFRKSLVDEQDVDRCNNLIEAMAQSDTWWVPTLQVLQMNALAHDDSFRSDPRLKYIPVLIREGMWMPDADRAAAKATDESGRNLYELMYQTALGHVGKSHAAGVRVLAGTDAGDTYVFPGFSVHDELVELVAAGMSPGDALKSATLDAAIFGGVEHEFGSIAVGKAADMILLDANPFMEIGNSRRIRGLIFNGQYFDRAALDTLLHFAEQQANSIHTNIHLLWSVVNSPLMRVQLAD